MPVGCFAILLLALSPRVVIFFTWLFTRYFDRAYESNWVPFLGFFLAPWATLLYAIGANEFSGSWRWILAGVGLLIDAGVLGGGRRQRRRQPPPGQTVIVYPPPS